MAANKEYQSFEARARAKHGDAFDDTDLHPQFRGLFNDRRVKVSRDFGDGEPYTRTGRIGATTGHKPAFLLMHRSSDTGSSDVLSGEDKVTHVQHGRTYVPVENLYNRGEPIR